MRVVLVAVVLFVAACTGPAHSSSTPQLTPLKGHAGPMLSVDGDTAVECDLLGVAHRGWHGDSPPFCQP